MVTALSLVECGFVWAGFLGVADLEAGFYYQSEFEIMRTIRRMKKMAAVFSLSIPMGANDVGFI